MVNVTTGISQQEMKKIKKIQCIYNCALLIHKEEIVSCLEDMVNGTGIYHLKQNKVNREDRDIAYSVSYVQKNKDDLKVEEESSGKETREGERMQQGG